jgi:hypothetical protein
MIAELNVEEGNLLDKRRIRWKERGKNKEREKRRLMNVGCRLDLILLMILGHMRRISVLL